MRQAVTGGRPPRPCRAQLDVQKCCALCTERFRPLPQAYDALPALPWRSQERQKTERVGAILSSLSPLLTFTHARAHTLTHSHTHTHKCRGVHGMWVNFAAPIDSPIKAAKPHPKKKEIGQTRGSSEQICEASTYKNLGPVRFLRLAGPFCLA